MTGIIGAAIAFFGILLLAIIAYAGRSANETATERERTLVENALNHRIARMQSEQKSVAWWDDAVTNIADEAINFDFADTEFGIFLTETYDHDEVHILDGKDQPVYSYFDGKRQAPADFAARESALAGVIAEARGRAADSRLQPRPDTFSNLQSNYRILAGGGSSARWAGHIVTLEGRPAIVSAMTIVPNIEMDLLKGTPHLLIDVEYIDEPLISEIGRSLLLNGFELTPQPAQGEAIVSEAFNGDDNILIGYLNWITRRPGHVLLTIILPLVAFGVLATGVLAATMLTRLSRTSDELAKREADARHEAKHDALSGLPNRVHMMEKIDGFLQGRLLETHDNRAVAAYIDIDRFKDINDTLGHQAGDRLIQLVAERLKGCLRRNDFLARFGGDEFVILCAPAGHEASASLAERVAKAFASPFVVYGQSIRVSASLGIALAPDNGQTADVLMRHADIALYEAKDRGRDCAVLFSEDMAQQVERRRTIELDLRSAIETDMLCLHYQPVVASDTGKIVGLEALLRWRHPVHGEMSPADFIPIAENAGLLPSLGEWVLNQAMKDASRWADLDVSINLSPAQFRHVDLESALRRLVAEYGVDPGRFVLELTEGVLLETTDHTNAILDTIRAIGFKTALDDFGTGYSSLAYLCNFKFDKIKIDRSFVSRISRVDISRTIVQSVVSIGRGLGMDIVAEGVETEFEAVTMAKFGCTELQGYYFSKPLPPEDMVAFLRAFQPKRILPPVSHLRPVSPRGARG
ncbi:MAG: putative bifunctional diguanylate cyclase/phosphodiesterase [Methyloceanibacter sp.]